MSDPDAPDGGMTTAAVAWADWELPDPRVAPAAAVRAAEETLDVTLPADYLRVARRHQGRAPTPSVFDLPDGTGSILDHLLHFEPAPRSSNLVVAADELADVLPAGVVPFAADPGGNYLCFDYCRAPRNPPVVFWAHDEVGAAPQRVAESFTALLEHLHE